MVQITGKYLHAGDDNFVEYLKDHATPNHVDKALVFAKSKPIIEIKENGGEYTLDVTNEGEKSTTKFRLNEPFDEVFPHGVSMKSIVKKEGDDKFTFETDLPEGGKMIRAYKFSDDGITVHLSSAKSPTVATRKYKRV